MNVGLILSYIVAGVITMALLSMNISMQRSTAELALLSMKKEHMAAVGEMIEYDISKAGYDVDGVIPDAIKKADSTIFVFEADVDNNGYIDEITWEFTTNPVTSTDNPDDFILRRTQINDIDNESGGLLSLLGVTSKTDVTDITFGITDMNFTYYANTGSGIALSMPVSGAGLPNITQIGVSVTMQSDEMINTVVQSNGRRITTHFDKIFSPVNINN